MDRHSIQYHVEKGAKGIILNTPAIATVLVDILQSNSDLKTTKHAMNWLQWLSEDTSVLFRIYQSNGIPILIKLLNAPEKVSIHAIVILWKLLLRQEGSTTAVCKARGLQKMVMILKSNDESFLCYVTCCLHILACQNPENRLIIVSNGGHSELMRIMGTYNSDTLLYLAVVVLKILSSDLLHKQAIVSAAVQTFSKHLDDPCQKLFLNSLFILRHLSDAAYELETNPQFSKRLVQLLGRKDMKIVCYTAAILANLTSNSPANKVVVCQLNGVGALVKVIWRAGNEEEMIKQEIIEPVICTLHHLTHSHPEAETARHAVRLHYGFPVIAKYLKPPIRWPLIIAAIGLVRNLVHCPDNHEPLLEVGAVRTLRDMLHSVYQAILRNRQRLSCYTSQPIVIDGVKMEDIVELILLIFLDIAGNASIKPLLKCSSIRQTYKQILEREHSKLQFPVRCIAVILYGSKCLQRQNC